MKVICFKVQLKGLKKPKNFFLDSVVAVSTSYKLLIFGSKEHVKFPATVRQYCASFAIDR